MVDRLLTINIRNYLVKQSVRKRPMKISKYVKDRIGHYTKTDVENVKISKELNELIIKKHAKNMLPLKVTIKMTEGKAMVSPFAEAKSAAAAKPAAASIAAAEAKKPTKPEAAKATPAKSEKKAEPKPEAKK